MMNRIRKRAVVFAAGIAASIVAHATVIDFTAAEGYTNGVLEGQADGKWSIEFADGFPGDSSYLVDAGGAGTLSYTNNTSWVKANYNEALTKDVLSFEIDFSFTRDDLTAANKQFFWPGLKSESNGVLSAYLRINSDTNSFSILGWASSGSGQGSSTITFSGTEIGLDDAGGSNQSANLRMTLVASHNGSDSWNSTVMLYNVDTDSVVASASWSWTGDGSWNAVDKNFYISSAYIADLTSMKVEIDKVTLNQQDAGSVDLDVEFSASEGYSNGNLSGQPLFGTPWTVDGGSSYTVDSGGSGSLSYTNNASWTKATYGAALAGDHLNLELDFQFTREDLSAANKQFVWPTLISESHGSLSGFLSMGSTINTFLLRGSASSGGSQNSALLTFSGTEIGLDDAGGTNQSANLRLILASRHNGSDNWTSKISLYNVDAETVVASASWIWTGDGSWYTVDKYAQINSGQIADLTAMTVEIDRMNLEVPTATGIGFSFFEGYLDGDLDGQPLGGTYTWDVDFDAGDWDVLNEKAQITSDTANFRGARWSEAFSGTNLSQTANLSFTRSVESPAAAKTLFYLGINELAVRGGKAALVGVRQVTGSDQYQLAFFENVGTGDSLNSLTFGGSNIGLTAGGEDTTDMLTLVLTHVYNGSDSWTTTAALSNGTSEVATLSRTWSADGGPAGWSDADKFLTLSAGNIGDTTGVTVNFDHLWMSGAEPAPPAPTYANWAADFGLSGADTNMTADLEYGGLGDGMNNLLEYALGGNPTVDDAAAILPSTSLSEDGSWFYYVHNERTDDTNLVYAVKLVSDLVSGTWATNGVDFVGESVADTNSFKSVTNRTDVGNQEFIRLSVEHN